MIKYITLVIILLLHVCKPANSQSKASKFTASDFFFPKTGNKAIVVSIDEKGNEMRLSMNRYYLAGFKQIIDEFKLGSDVTSSFMKYLLVSENEISCIASSDLLKNTKTSNPKPVIIFKIPESEGTTANWVRVEDDGTVVKSTSEFTFYPFRGQSIHCIKITETSVLAKLDLNTIKESFYMYNIGYAGSRIYNKSLNQFVPYDKIKTMTYDKRLD